MSTVRRVFFYALALITLGIFGTGTGTLLGLGFDLFISGTSAAQSPGYVQQQISLGLAMFIIGGPLWFLFWRSIQKNVAAFPTEIGSAIRKFYLNLVLLVSALFLLNAGGGIIEWLLSGASRSSFPPHNLAILLVSLGIWLFHWQIAEGEGTPTPVAKTLRRWYIYILAARGITPLAFGIVRLASTAIIYLPLWGRTNIYGPFWTASTQNAISWIIIGGLAWYFHWFYLARNDIESILRQVYLYLVAILGSSVAVLVALTITLYKIILWGLGGVTESLGAHFQALAWTIPTMLVAGALWMYHQRVTQEEAGQFRERQLSAERVHSYLMTALGLGTMVTGLVIFIGILIDSINNTIQSPVVISAEWWHDPLALGISLVIVAAPIWWYFWNLAIKRVRTGGLVESKARSRRIFLYVVIGAGILAITAGAVWVIYQLLRGILAGNLADFLSQTKWSWQTLITAVPIFIYHWQVMREDQRLGAEAAVIHKTVTLLLSSPSPELASRLEDKLGFKIRLLNGIGTEGITLTDEAIATLVEEVQKSPGSKVIVVISSTQQLVIPYEE